MAEKKTKQAPAAPANNPATEANQAAVPATEKGVNDRFGRVFVDGKASTPVKADGTAGKIAPQAQAIANVLEAIGEGNTLSRKELVDKLTIPGVLTTKQPPGRILSYYQKELVQKKVITMTKAA